MTPPNDLSGARKAALLLVQLGTERAGKVLQALADDEIETVVGEVAAIEETTEESLTSVLTEFVTRVDGPRPTAAGPAMARKLLTTGLGAERATAMFDRLATAPFQGLADLHPEQAAGILAGEHPQTVALVLNSLGPDRALKLMRRFPEDRQGDIAYRMAVMEPPSAEAIQAVEAGLARKIAESSSDGAARRDQDQTAALVALLVKADAEMESAIMQKITELDPKLAAEIRVKLFAFDDLVKLEDKALQVLLREADTKTLALALKGASDAVRRKFFSNLSERASENLSEEIDLLGAQRKADVDEARLEVLGAMRRLEEAGTITISRGDADLVA